MIAKLSCLLLILFEPAWPISNVDLFTKLYLPNDKIVREQEHAGIFHLADCTTLCLLHDNDQCDGVMHNKEEGTCSLISLVQDLVPGDKLAANEGKKPTNARVFGR